MARAESHFSTAGEQLEGDGWSPNDAFQYLVREGRSPYHAIGELEDYWHKGLVPLSFHHFVDGVLKRTDNIPPDFIPIALKLRLVEGRAVIRELMAFDDGQYEYFVSREAILRACRKRGTPTWELIRRLAAEEWPNGYGHVETRVIIKKIGDKLHKMKAGVPSREVFERAIGRRKK